MPQQIVEAPTPQPYNAFMEGLQAEVLTWGLESAILEPALFSPLPYWLGPKVVQEPGARVQRPSRRAVARRFPGGNWCERVLGVQP